MGLSYETTTFAGFARKHCGVDYTDTLTLGRQSLLVPGRLIDKVLTRFGPDDRLAASDVLSRGGDAFFQALGAQTVEALDVSSYEGAQIVHDLNAPVGEALHERYSCVFDGGVLHYVFNVPQALENVMRMVRIGGHFVGASMANNACGHGLYQFAPEVFYAMFGPQNGFAETQVFLVEDRSSKLIKVPDPRQTQQHFHFSNSRLTHLFVVSKKVAPTPARVAPALKFEYAGLAAGTAPQDAPANTGFVTRMSRTLKARLPQAVYVEIAHAYLGLHALMKVRGLSRYQRIDPYRL